MTTEPTITKQTSQVEFFLQNFDSIRSNIFKGIKDELEEYEDCVVYGPRRTLEDCTATASKILDEIKAVALINKSNPIHLKGANLKIGVADLRSLHEIFFHNGFSVSDQGQETIENLAPQNEKERKYYKRAAIPKEIIIDLSRLEFKWVK